MKKQVVIVIFCFISTGIFFLQCDEKISAIEAKSYKVSGVLYGRGLDTSETGWINMQAIVPMRNKIVNIFQLTITDSIIGHDTVMTDLTGKFSATITSERIGIVVRNVSNYKFPHNVIDNVHYFPVIKIIDYNEMGVDSIFISDTIY